MIYEMNGADTSGGSVCCVELAGRQPSCPFGWVQPGASAEGSISQPQAYGLMGLAGFYGYLRYSLSKSGGVDWMAIQSKSKVLYVG